jgi:DNA-binding transcriptional MerR regulator/effector-binding domain-containing protein
MRFSIGEFSRMTSLSIKTLRLYHEREILVPTEVDEFTGYRHYSGSDFERAKSIQLLKQFDFSLAEIKDILDEIEDETDMLDSLGRKLEDIRSKIRRYHEISRSIERIIQKERETAMQNHTFEIEEKEIETVLIAGMRVRGKYPEVGKYFSIIAKKMGPRINGKAMTLYYDPDYREEDADFEPCFPVRKGRDAEGISVRELKGGRAVTLIHKGPYENIGESYKKLFDAIHQRKLATLLPTREIYWKGPGMILKGNPRNYLTELQVLIGKGGT